MISLLILYKLLPAVYDRNSRGLLRYGLHCETYNLICRLGFSRVYIDDISAWPEHATYLFKLLVSAVFDQNVCGWVWYIIFECHVGTCVRQVLHIQGLQSSRWSTKYETKYEVRFLKDVIDTFNSGLQEGLLNTQNASEPVDSSPGAGSEVFAWLPLPMGSFFEAKDTSRRAGASSCERATHIFAKLLFPIFPQLSIAVQRRNTSCEIASVFSSF